MEENLVKHLSPINEIDAKLEVPYSPHVTNLKEDHQLLPQLFATITVSWLSIIIGYASAYSSPAGSSMMRDFNITESELSWICSFLPIGAIVGSLSGGPYIERFGRKQTLLAANIIFLFIWTLKFYASNVRHLYLSRLLCGYSVGLASFTIPVYLTETVQFKIRGRLGLLPTTMGNFGILLCFTLGLCFEWQGLAGIGIILSIPYLIMIWLIPETPHWLANKNRMTEARNALQWLRGNNYNINREFSDLLSYRANDNDGVDCTIEEPRPVLSKVNIKAFLIVVGLMFFQQCSGVNVVIFYTTRIFVESGSSLNALHCTAIIGIVNFMSIFLGMFFIDHLGRKVLLLCSSTVLAVTLFVLSTYFLFLKVYKSELTYFDWVPLSSFIFYAMGFSFGLGPIPWLMMGEILPAAIRGSSASFCTAFNWSCTFVITKTFPVLEGAVGCQYIFFFFGIMMLFSLLFVQLVVPETRQKTLQDIQRILSRSNYRPSPSKLNI